jgi:hypothetical protein
MQNDEAIVRIGTSGKINRFDVDPASGEALDNLCEHVRSIFRFDQQDISLNHIRATFRQNGERLVRIAYHHADQQFIGARPEKSSALRCQRVDIDVIFCQRSANPRERSGSIVKEDGKLSSASY